MKHPISRLSQHIMTAARDTGLSPRLIAAVIMTESAGEIWAFRYEPAFYKKYLQGKSLKVLGGHVPSPDVVSTETELFGRAVSWGAMQMMGQVAREHGFSEDHLTKLMEPEYNIPLGARILAKKISKAGTLRGGLLLWNGGGDPHYPDRVIKNEESGECDFLLM